MSVVTHNPFSNYHLDLFCSDDDLKPFLNYIYFIDGFAYAANGQIMAALSLKDLDASDKLIECLNGHKIKYDEYQFFKSHKNFIPLENGKILVNLDKTITYQLFKNEYHDINKDYLKIFGIIDKVKMDLLSQSENISEFKVDFRFLELVGKAFKFNHIATFYFLNSKRVVIKMERLKKSMAIIMSA